MMDNVTILQDATISTWISNINVYKYSNIKYWIHKIPIHDNWVMTTFNYDLTNIDLKTTDLHTAEERASIMMRTKTNMVLNAISTLTTFTRKIRKNTIQLSPQVNKSIIEFTSKIRQFNI